MSALKFSPGQRCIWYKELSRAKWRQVPVVFLNYAGKTNTRCTILYADGIHMVKRCVNLDNVETIK